MVKPASVPGGVRTSLSISSRSVPLWIWLNVVSSVLVIDGSTHAGTVTMPSARAALVRWWPAMMRPSTVTMIGLQKPRAVIEPFSISIASSAILRGL